MIIALLVADFFRYLTGGITPAGDSGETSHHWDLFTTATLVTFLPEGNSPLTVKLQMSKSMLELVRLV